MMPTYNPLITVNTVHTVSTYLYKIGACTLVPCDMFSTVSVHEKCSFIKVAILFSGNIIRHINKVTVC